MMQGQTLPEPVQNAKLTPDRLFGRPEQFTAALAKIFFVAVNTSQGAELWCSDGTANGTGPVKDIYPGRGSSLPEMLVAKGAAIFFVADDGVHGREWWTSDGTEVGTRIVADLTEGVRSSDFSAAILVGTKLWFFAASATVEGEFELWTSDGTDAGTQPVAEGFRCPANLTPYGDGVAFTQDEGLDSARKQLWKSDGTLAGTAFIQSFAVGQGSVDSLTQVGNDLFFAVRAGRPTYVSDTRLWKTDGTTAGTVDLHQFSASNSYDGFLRSLTAFGDKLLFAGSDSATGTELWISDGTVAGTALLKDMTPGEDNSEPQLIGQMGGKFYLKADGLPWVSDGTAEGTVRMGEFVPQNGSPRISLGSTIAYFDYADPSLGLWKTDGTLTGSGRLPSAKATVTGGFWRGERVVVGDDLYLGGYEDDKGTKLWRLPAATGVPVLLEAFKPGTWEIDRDLLISNPETAVIGNKVLFASEDKRFLWSSDGRRKGTKRIMRIPGYLHEGTPTEANFMVHNETLYFVTATGSSKHQLAWTDGSSRGSGATGLMNFQARETPAFLRAGLGEHLYFSPLAGDLADSLRVAGGGIKAPRAVKPDQEAAVPASEAYVFSYSPDSEIPEQLWVCDGSREGTKPLVLDPPVYYPVVRGKVEGLTYFTASTDADGYGLWVTGGTVESTRLVKDLSPGVLGEMLYFGAFVEFKGEAYYLMQVDDVLGFWRSNGTTARTSLVKELPFRAGDLTRHAPSFAVLNDVLYLNGRVDGGGYELWKSDGTAVGTVPVADVHPGYNGSDPRDLTAGINVLYFTADDGLHGRELWQSDGTAEGTRMVADLTDGDGLSADPVGLSRSSEKLFFLSRLPGIGRRMHVMNLE
ncbi:ELWxxDGT repeat protein [Luteolibacter luteus]|uniref:Uncharacterized protein n=1 Tax=Luteolibacter luteus TaxID=2728835 RepID=A0A858RS55_9BACT|nr:ELWxxDGT repeat protein [Luteolibacter luteus]QJE98773.1 hypothetical protein HHL09_24330 [Luteolibacter luteus]